MYKIFYTYLAEAFVSLMTILVHPFLAMFIPQTLKWDSNTHHRLH